MRYACLVLLTYSLGGTLAVLNSKRELPSSHAANAQQQPSDSNKNAAGYQYKAPTEGGLTHSGYAAATAQPAEATATTAPHYDYTAAQLPPSTGYQYAAPSQPNSNNHIAAPSTAYGIGPSYYNSQQQTQTGYTYAPPTYNNHDAFTPPAAAGLPVYQQSTQTPALAVSTDEDVQQQQKTLSQAPSYFVPPASAAAAAAQYTPSFYVPRARKLSHKMQNQMSRKYTEALPQTHEQSVSTTAPNLEQNAQQEAARTQNVAHGNGYNYQRPNAYRSGSTRDYQQQRPQSAVDYTDLVMQKCRADEALTQIPISHNSTDFDSAARFSAQPQQQKLTANDAQQNSDSSYHGGDISLYQQNSRVVAPAKQLLPALSTPAPLSAQTSSELPLRTLTPFQNAFNELSNYLIRQHAQQQQQRQLQQQQQQQQRQFQQQQRQQQLPPTQQLQQQSPPTQEQQVLTYAPTHAHLTSPLSHDNAFSNDISSNALAPYHVPSFSYSTLNLNTLPAIASNILTSSKQPITSFSIAKSQELTLTPADTSPSTTGRAAADAFATPIRPFPATHLELPRAAAAADFTAQTRILPAATLNAAATRSALLERPYTAPAGNFNIPTTQLLPPPQQVPLNLLMSASYVQTPSHSFEIPYPDVMEMAVPSRELFQANVPQVLEQSQQQLKSQSEQYQQKQQLNQQQLGPEQLDQHLQAQQQLSQQLGQQQLAQAQLTQQELAQQQLSQQQLGEQQLAQAQLTQQELAQQQLAQQQLSQQLAAQFLSNPYSFNYQPTNAARQPHLSYGVPL